MTSYYTGFTVVQLFASVCLILCDSVTHFVLEVIINISLAPLDWCVGDYSVYVVECVFWEYTGQNSRGDVNMSSATLLRSALALNKLVNKYFPDFGTVTYYY